MPVGDPIFTDHKVNHRRHKCRISLGGYVGFGHFIVDELVLCCSHSTEHRTYPRLIHVDTNSEVHLVWIWVGATGCSETKDRVGRQYRELFKHGIYLMAAKAASIEQRWAPANR